MKKSKDNIEKQVKENLNKLYIFSTINEDDFIGIDKQVKENISFLLTSLPIQPELFALGDGSIQMEYGNVRGNYLEFIILPDNKIKYLKKNKQNVVNSKVMNYDVDFIIKEIDILCDDLEKNQKE